MTETVSDFAEGQWWLQELDAMVASGTDDQKRAVAVVRNLLRVAHAAALPAQPEGCAEPLRGWKLNHVQYVRGQGTAQIGYLDPEDDRFSPIVTVDTGLYYQDDQAAPLAVAILGALADAAPQQDAGNV